MRSWVRFLVTLGTVVRFEKDRGFGFIETEESDEDVFFHVNDVNGRDPSENEQVEFVIEEAEKGPRAKHIEFFRLDTRAR